jgi:hypothetical protein
MSPGPQRCGGEGGSGRPVSAGSHDPWRTRWYEARAGPWRDRAPARHGLPAERLSAIETAPRPVQL